LDVRIAHVHGVGVTVHNRGRFVRPTSTPAESLLISSLTGFLLPEM